MFCWGDSAGWFMPLAGIVLAVFVAVLFAVGAWGIVTLARRSDS